MSYILIITAVLLLAGDFVISKLYQSRAGASIVPSLFFNAILGLSTAILICMVRVVSGEIGPLFTPFSVLMATGVAVAGVTYLLIGFRMLKAGKMAVYTLFLMTGGMVIPYVWGIFALNEKFSILRFVGLLFIIGGVICSNQKKESINKRYLLMGVCVFVLNGLLSIISKMHQIEVVQTTVSTLSFVALTGILKFILCTIALIVVCRKQSQTIKDIPVKTCLPIILVSAIVGGTSYLLQLISAVNIPATLLYPLMTGGSVIFTAIAGRLFFKEKLSKMATIGIALCFVGTCMFL